MTLRCIQLRRRHRSMLRMLLRKHLLLLSSIKLVLLQEEQLLVLSLFRGKTVLRDDGSCASRWHRILLWYSCSSGVALV